MGRKPRRVAVIDAETDPFKRGRLHIEAFVWGFYDGNEFRHFERAEDLVEFLRPQEIIVYAHNGGKFDYHFLVQYFEPWSDCLVINGRMAQFRIGLCEFRDSWNILPERLAKFNANGHSKLAINYDWFERENRARNMPEILRYLREDCIVLYEAVSAFIATYGLSLTLAGAAMRNWQKLTETEAPRSTGGFYEQHAKYYFGGRVECFRSGVISRPGRDFTLADINSAYPFAMLADHPISVASDHVACRPGDPISTESLYDLECAAQGCFPWLDGEKLTFPSDSERRTYHVTGWELAAALRTKAILPGSLKIHGRRDFAKTINFRPYVEHFYKLKQRAQKGSLDYIFAKLMMNSLYGKFAANPDNYGNFGIIPSDYIDAVEAMDDAAIGKHYGPWEWSGSIGPWALMRSKLLESQERYYNVATAASITGFVRAKLWEHIHAIRRRGGEILYCDTDSIAFYPGKSDPTKYSDKLGDWTNEGCFDLAAIGGKKLYAFRRTKPDKEGKLWKTASKGAKLTYEEIVRIAQGEVVTFEPEVPTFSVHKAPTLTKRRIRATA